MIFGKKHSLNFTRDISNTVVFLVGSHLEFGSILWSPATSQLSGMVEKLQKRLLGSFIIKISIIIRAQQFIWSSYKEYEIKNLKTRRDVGL